jgi:hypothetical protein
MVPVPSRVATVDEGKYEPTLKLKLSGPKSDAEKSSQPLNGKPSQPDSSYFGDPAENSRRSEVRVETNACMGRLFRK